MTTRTASAKNQAAAPSNGKPSNGRVRTAPAAGSPATAAKAAANRNRGSDADTLGLFLRDLDHHPLPDHDAQTELAKRVAAGDDEARREMVAANLRLVVHWARRYQDRGVDLPDLVQEGTFGLMRAVDKFDWERGLPLLDVRHMVDPPGPPASRPAARPDHQASDGGGRAQPAGGRRSVGADPPVPAATDRRRDGRRHQHHSRDPFRPQPVARVVASLDQPATADSTATLGDLVSTDLSDFEDDVASELTLDLVRQAVDRLTDLQRQVIRHRFGFDGSDPASLQTTAERLGIGVRKVRQAEAEALEILADSEMLEAAHEAA